MVEVLLLGLALSTILVILNSLKKSRKAYLTMPFLAALTIVYWMLPQALSVINSGTQPPLLAHSVFLMVVISSFAALVVGWSHSGASRQLRDTSIYSKTSPPARDTLARIPKSRLRATASVFVIFALTIQMLIQLQPPEALTARQPSGLITILKFLSAVNPLGIFLSFAFYSTYRSLYGLVIFMVSLACYQPAVMLSFKRVEIIELAFSLLFAVATPQKPV